MISAWYRITPNLASWLAPFRTFQLFSSCRRYDNDNLNIRRSSLSDRFGAGVLKMRADARSRYSPSFHSSDPVS